MLAKTISAIDFLLSASALWPVGGHGSYHLWFSRLNYPHPQHLWHQGVSILSVPGHPECRIAEAPASDLTIRIGKRYTDPAITKRPLPMKQAHQLATCCRAVNTPPHGIGCPSCSSHEPT
jgi:hypothetical protein